MVGRRFDASGQRFSLSGRDQELGRSTLFPPDDVLTSVPLHNPSPAAVAHCASETGTCSFLACVLTLV